MSVDKVTLHRDQLDGLVRMAAKQQGLLIGTGCAVQWHIVPLPDGTSTVVAVVEALPRKPDAPPADRPGWWERLLGWLEQLGAP